MEFIKLGSNKMFIGTDAVNGLLQLDGTKRKAFIVMNGTILEEVGSLKTVTDKLDENKFEWMIYTDVEPEPSYQTIVRGVKEMKNFSPDWVIGFGGGSAMDAAKAMWVYYENDSYSTLEHGVSQPYIKNLRNKAKLCCIPTSAGTGSEVTRAALIIDSDTRKKYAIRDFNGQLIPDVAILDAAFTKTMPKSLIAASGMDAITHAIESYITPKANTFSKTLSIGSFIYGYKNLPIAYSENTEKSRNEMLAVSCLGGMAFSNSALGIVHSIAHSLGAEYNIPHGLANAIILPYGIRFNNKDSKVKKLYQELASYIQEEDLYEAITELNKKLEIPSSLSKFVKEEEFKRNLDYLITKVQADVCLPTNPVQPTEEDIRVLLLAVYHGEGS